MARYANKNTAGVALLAALFAFSFLGPAFLIPRIATFENAVRPASRPLCGRDGSRASLESSTVVHAHVTAAGRLLTELSASPVLSATSAGVCAAVVMAFLSAILDPIKDRLLGRRLYFGSPSKSWRCRFEIGFLVQLIKFPIFEPLLLWLLSTKFLTCGLFARAALAGFVFAVFTLPFTNFRMAVSNSTMASSPFKAVFPTIARDTVYAVGRAALPAWIIAKYSSKAHRLSVASPEVLFAAVVGACLLAAPFNELRDRQLSRAHAANFMPLKSTFFAVIRSLLQAESLVLGYRYAPSAVHAVADAASHWKITKVLLAPWKVAPDVELWALAGGVSMLLLLSCMIKQKMTKMWRSQPDLLKELLLEN